MAETNSLMGTTMNILLLGLLIMSLFSGYVLIVNNEGRGEILDNYSVFENLNANLSEKMIGIQNVSNLNSNLSAQYDPEQTISGADKSGNAMGMNARRLVVGVFEQISIFFALIFGNIYVTTLSVFLGSILVLSLFFQLIRWIRRGD